MDYHDAMLFLVLPIDTRVRGVVSKKGVKIFFTDLFQQKGRTLSDKISADKICFDMSFVLI